MTSLPETRAPLTRRRPTNVTLPEGLLQAARELRVNVSQACEVGLAREVKEKQKEQWLRENREAMDEWNDYVDKNGLPLAAYRDF